MEYGIYCGKCMYYNRRMRAGNLDSENCTHSSNTEWRQTYRESIPNYLENPMELNKNNDCKNYKIQTMSLPPKRT